MQPPFTLQHVARTRSTPLQCRVRPQEQESVKVFKLNFLQVYRGSEFQPKGINVEYSEWSETEEGLGESGGF